MARAVHSLVAAIGHAAVIVVLASLAGLGLGLARGTLTLTPPAKTTAAPAAAPSMKAPLAVPAAPAARMVSPALTAPAAPAPGKMASDRPAATPAPAPAPAPAAKAARSASMPTPQKAAAPQADPAEGEGIAPQAAQRLLAAGGLAVDARRPEDFALGHLPGALNLPAEEFDSHFAQLQPRLPSRAPLVVYCGGAECGLSKELAGMLKDMGFSRVEVLRGGIDAWKAAGLPVEK
jgi:rhodanese-related sulfurtransferase